MKLPKGAKVASKEVCEKAAYVVCIPADWPTLPEFLIGNNLGANQYGRCSRCKRAIQFRPYAPKKPPKLCMPCLAAETGSAALQEHCLKMEKNKRPHGE